MMQKKITLACFVLLMGQLSSYSQSPIGFVQVLHSAKTNNPFLKSISYNKEIAQSDIVTAGLRPNPILNNQTMQLVNSKYNAPGTKFYQPENRQVWWQLTKPFQLNNQRRYKIDVATKSVAVAEKTYTDAERNVLLDAGNKWLDVWYNKVNLDLIVEAKANIDSLVKTQEIRLKNQVISTSDFTRTQLLSQQYSLQLKSAEQAYRNELKTLQFIIGSNDSLVIDVKDNITIQALTEQIDSLVSLSFAQRPDLQVAHSNVDVAQSNIKLQQSLAKPVPELGFIWNPQNTIPYFGFFGTIELPFFSRNQGEIKKSKLSLQQSQQSLTALQLQVQTEVQTTFRSYEINKENVGKYKNILQKSEEVLQSVKYAYTRGGTTIIDFLEAQRTWYDTQKMYYDAVLNYRKSYVQLLFVTGLINQL